MSSIVISRELLDDPDLQSPERLSVWIHLLLLADEQGRVSITTRKLAQMTGTSQSFVSRLLNQFSIKSDSKLTQDNGTITIANISAYKKADSKVTQKRLKKEPVNNPVDNSCNQAKFNPEGKRKYLDWVYLSPEQINRLQRYYTDRGLTPENLKEAIRELDAWFSNNPRMRQKRVDDAKALMGWPLDRALERKRNLERSNK